MEAADAPTTNDNGWTETRVKTIRLTSHQHELRIVLLRKGHRAMIGLREYREFADGTWHAHKSGVSFDVARLPVIIRSLLKAYEMTKGAA